MKYITKDNISTICVGDEKIMSFDIDRGWMLYAVEFPDNVPASQIDDLTFKIRKRSGQGDMDKEECFFCKNHEPGDTLYEDSEWDGGIGFDYIRNIKYCPLCGRRLKAWKAGDD